MARSIVCGVDGSADSEAALAVAAEMAERLGARLVLANVVEHVHSTYAAVGPMGPGTVARAPLGDVLAEQVRAAERLLEEIVEQAGVEATELRVVSGFAAQRLADLADEEGAELIVVGSRGRGALKAAFLGSVSTTLSGIARCPVLVVPPGARGGPARGPRPKRRRRHEKRCLRGVASLIRKDGDRACGPVDANARAVRNRLERLGHAHDRGQAVLAGDDGGMGEDPARRRHQCGK
jgi:nucleotide-binding universal stress UspA family protein